MFIVAVRRGKRGRTRDGFRWISWGRFIWSLWREGSALLGVKYMSATVGSVVYMNQIFAFRVASKKYLEKTKDLKEAYDSVNQGGEGEGVSSSVYR